MHNTGLVIEMVCKCENTLFQSG